MMRTTVVMILLLACCSGRSRRGLLQGLSGFGVPQRDEIGNVVQGFHLALFLRREGTSLRFGEELVDAPLAVCRKAQSKNVTRQFGRQVGTFRLNAPTKDGRLTEFEKGLRHVVIPADASWPGQNAFVLNATDEVMSSTLSRVRELIERREIRVSEHASLELQNDDLFLDDLIQPIKAAVLVEDDPDYRRGSCVLVRYLLDGGNVAHAVWGIRTGHETPAVLVTAWVPDPSLWDAEFLRRVR